MELQDIRDSSRQAQLMPRRRLDIPTLFYSEETDEPFCQCVDCERDLLQDGTEYTIQKVFVRGEAVFEYAMCRLCAERLREGFSEETQLAYQAFLFTSADLSDRVRLVRDPDEHELPDWIDACLVCRKPRSECYRYSLSGLLTGSQLVLAEFPAMICDDCEKDLGELTSQKTRDRWDRFVEDHFEGPPGIEMDSPSSHPIAV